MNQDLARLLVRLHSRSWRERYGPECEALLLDLPARPHVVVDCVGNALASRSPKYPGIVLPAVAVVALAVFLGVPLHRAGDVRATKAAVSLVKRPGETSNSGSRGPYCYPAGMRFSARVHCA